MNETTKTLIFVGLAALCLVGAWWGGPTPTLTEVQDRVDTVLFPDFDDPYKATRMEVVSYDEALDVVRNFEVAQQNGQWVIPSHGNYPADAEERLKNAATLLIDLKPISRVTDRHEDQALYGVVQPDKNTTQVGEQGVGTLVSFRGEKNSPLAEIVIGKPVKGSETQHYVRKPGEDNVYTVQIDPTQISTKFEDWIEKDLLKISGFDIEAMEIRDYSVEPTLTAQGLRLQLEPRFELAVRWNADDYRWDLDQLREFRRDGYEPRELREGEELDRTNLDNMKNAIGELQIVDVRRKPKGLRATTESQVPIWEDQEAIQSLTEHGFYPQPEGDDSLKLYCSDGEVDIATKDGVRYTLWFGSQTPTVDSQGESRLNRYVMISASANPDAFEKPILELPPEPTPSPWPQTTDESAEPTSDAATTNVPSETATSAGAAEETPADGTEDPAAETSERDRLIKEYEQKLDAYNDEVQKATEKARDVNLRLGDWYFVVDEDVYDRIRLRRSQVIKETEAAAPEAGEGVDAFRALQDQGLQPDEPDH